MWLFRNILIVSDRGAVLERGVTLARKSAARVTVMDIDAPVPGAEPQPIARRPAASSRESAIGG
jgi:hypothetical protein